LSRDRNSNSKNDFLPPIHPGSVSYRLRDSEITLKMPGGWNGFMRPSPSPTFMPNNPAKQLK